MAKALVATDTGITPPRTSGNAATRRLIDKIATGALWGSAIFVVLLLAFMVVYLFKLGWGAASLSFITTQPSDIDAGGGISTEIFNSFYILILTLIFTIPIALFAGIYLQEYAKTGRFRDIVQFSAESLATVPSIVMGLFGLLVFVQTIHLGFTALSGALTLTILNLPSLMRVTQEALAGVPGTYREASLGLGATKWQTVTKVIVPSAIAQMTTGVVLISGRIFGETAALIYTAGVTVNHGKDAISFSPLNKGAESLAVHLWYVHSEGTLPDIDRIGNGSALVLLIMVLLFNVTARVVGRYLTKRFTGA